MAYVLRGRILNDIGQAGPAIQSVGRALAITPSNTEALVLKTSILAKLGRGQEALDLAQQTAEAYPTSLSTQASLASCYIESGNGGAALLQANSLINQFPGEPLGWIVQGDARGISWRANAVSFRVAKLLNPDPTNPLYRKATRKAWRFTLFRFDSISAAPPPGIVIVILIVLIPLFLIFAIFFYPLYIISVRRRSASIAQQERAKMRSSITAQERHFTSP